MCTSTEVLAQLAQSHPTESFLEKTMYFIPAGALPATQRLLLLWALVPHPQRQGNSPLSISGAVRWGRWWFGCSGHLFLWERGFSPGYTVGSRKVLQGGLLNSLHQPFPSVNAKGIPVQQFETPSCDSSRLNGFWSPGPRTALFHLLWIMIKEHSLVPFQSTWKGKTGNCFC